MSDGRAPHHTHHTYHAPHAHTHTRTHARIFLILTVISVGGLRFA